MNLQSLLQVRIQAATAQLTGEASVRADAIKPTKDPKFGDYQANGAMALAKQLGKKPQEVAKELIAKLDLTGLDTPEVAGPGFINIRFAMPWLAEQIREVAQDDRLGVPLVAKPLNYVIDYSSPNVAKPMHVGHLRSTIIGDSLTRMLRFLGHHVVTDNHLGDWGTQFGILIYGWKHFLNQAALDKDPVGEMVRIYIHVRNLIKEEGGDDEDDAGGKNIAEACRLETAKLHQGDPENVALWKRMMPWCQAELDRVYHKLGIHPYDVTLGESYYNPVLHEVVYELKAKGISEESRGAQVVFHGENQPPSLIQKGDGAYTYTTTDLATIRHRVTAFKANVCLYVVDFRQSLHFQQLFSIARRWGYTEVDLIHISFGSVLGADGKPIKTREGGAIELGSLLDEAIVRARKVVDENSPDLPATDRFKVAEAVGIGAVKYADLCQNRSSDYIFNWEKMLATKGSNTGAYMQYAYARCRSIFRKVGVTPESIRQLAPTVTLDVPQERALALAVLRFPEALDAALAEYKPSAITQYLWDLANAFSSFFEKCHVARAETKELQQSRLLLCDLTARVLQKGLDLLGIQTIEQM